MWGKTLKRALHGVRVRPLSTSAAKRSSKFATTPIFYVNANPHIGHLHSMVLADCFHRWQLLLGNDSVLSTGTDEHGSKVLQASQNAGKDPKEFVDWHASQFKKLADAAKIDYTRFIRTTDPDHILEVQRFWTLLLRNDFIYKGHHEGWYCTSDETFVTESDLMTLENGQKITIESRNEVIWVKEENYFFKLSAFREKLLEWMKESPNCVIPQARWNQLVLDLENDPLQDLSISRPASRCSWGVPVPGDSEQCMYVWLDALVNYYTVAESYKAETGKSCWPPSVHVVGKDIMRFHCVYWPAFLMAAGKKLPESVVVHAHWLVDGFKMSKSKRNVVDPFDAIERFGPDPVRYFLMHDSSLASDTPFSYEDLVHRHNINLINKLGNLVSRICTEKFNIADAVNTSAPLKGSSQLLDSCKKYMSNYNVTKMLQALNDEAILANQDFHDAAPWKLESEQQREIIRLAADRARVIAILLKPVCPQYSETMLDTLMVDKDKRTAEFATLGADSTYGVGANKKGVRPFSLLVLPETEEAANAPATKSETSPGKPMSEKEARKERNRIKHQKKVSKN